MLEFVLVSFVIVSLIHVFRIFAYVFHHALQLQLAENVDFDEGILCCCIVGVIVVKVEVAF